MGEKRKDLFQIWNVKKSQFTLISESVAFNLRFAWKTYFTHLYLKWFLDFQDFSDVIGQPIFSVKARFTNSAFVRITLSFKNSFTLFLEILNWPIIRLLMNFCYMFSQIFLVREIRITNWTKNVGEFLFFVNYNIVPMEKEEEKNKFKPLMY